MGGRRRPGQPSRASGRPWLSRRLLAASAILCLAGIPAIPVDALSPAAAGPSIPAAGGSSAAPLRVVAGASVDGAVAISRATLHAHGTQDVLLADAGNQTYARIAGSLIGAFPDPAPLLFSGARHLDARTRTELVRLLPTGTARGAASVFLIGASLGNAVRAEVAALGVHVERLGGSSPAAAAAALAKRFYAGGGISHAALVIPRMGVAAAAAAGAWAAGQALPTLLAGSGSSLPAATLRYLKQAKPEQVTLIGSRTMIPIGQEHQIERLGISVRRASGVDAVSLSTQVALTWANPEAMPSGVRIRPVVMPRSGIGGTALAAALFARVRATPAGDRAPLLFTRALHAAPTAACNADDGRGPACYLMGSDASRLTAVGSRSALSDATMAVLSAARSAARPQFVPDITHIFLVVLENEDYEAAFGPNGPAEAPYLNRLLDQGTQASAYYGVDHNSLANYIAFTSGQPPTGTTRNDCPQYNCVYPENVQHIGDQLESIGVGWKAYLDGMNQACQHPPNEGTGDIYFEQGVPPGNTYATRHNPFMYYADLVHHADRCARHDLPYDQFPADLANHHVGRYTLIVPDLCNDGHDAVCLDGKAGGIPRSDAWLSREIPRILASPEYRNGGMLMITFDEAETSDTTGCCGDSQGGHIGMVVLSRTWGREAGYEAPTPANHYSLLATLEQAWGLPRLGGAGDPGVAPLSELFRRSPR